jgi:hypothetical protein
VCLSWRMCRVLQVCPDFGLAVLHGKVLPTEETEVHQGLFQTMRRLSGASSNCGSAGCPQPVALAHTPPPAPPSPCVSVAHAREV